MYRSDSAEMAAALGREAEHKGPAETGSAPAFFPLKCEHRRQRWLVAGHKKKGCRLHGGATPRLLSGW